MNQKELKIERWSVYERYKNYKSNNYYKEPLQFRPHPENVVRDVIMYHIYHNEGKLCDDALVQYIKNKIINDLNEIFVLYEYAPDAISTIRRLMSSKTHLGSADTYNEMMFHALTIKDTRDILIELISNVLIKCIPEPLGNIKFDVIMKDDVKDNVNNTNKSHKQTINNQEGETIMKGNPQNIEVGDVVRCESRATDDKITSVVLGIWDQGYTHIEDENTIDGYLVRATVMNKGTFANYPVKELTIIRKWNASVPAEQVKQSEVKSQPTYSFMMVTDKSFETLELAVKLIEGLTSADIMEYDQDNRIIEVNQNLVDKLCKFVNAKNRLFDLGYNRYVEFDGCGFWINNERINPQCFIDEIVEPIIVKELKRKALANKSN